MNPLKTRIAVLGLAAVFCAGVLALEAQAQSAQSTQPSGPTLAPAEYKPLPVGTRVDYGTWKYEVEKSKGADIALRTNDDRLIHHYGVFGRSGLAVYTAGDEEETAENYQGLWFSSLKGGAKSALDSLWPLKVGNKTRLTVKEERESTSGYWTPESRSWKITYEVVGTENLVLGGVRYATYVVREQGTSSSGAYSRTLWYHPPAGLILKTALKWTAGPKSGDDEDIDKLIGVRYPEGTTDLALKGERIPAAGVAVADLGAERTKQETAEKYKAGIERLRQEEAARQQAEIERLSREAEIARLSREAEANRGNVAPERKAPTEREQDERMERVLWTVAKTSRDVDDTKAYLDIYPSGRFAAEAKARLSVLEKFAAVEGIDFGAYHALVIGNDTHENLPDLTTAVNDAKAIAAVLTGEYGFKVKTLFNATHADIIDALDEYRETLTDRDNLLIYYAGHGWLDEDTGRGYWLPVDAKVNRRSRWVSNATISDTLKGLLAKHVMVVADSCYSGTLIRGAGVSLRSGEYWARMARKRTRVALTSGGLEPVADKGGGGHSPFATALLDALKGNEAVMDGTQLFSRVRRPVMLNANQTPEYSDVRNAGHDGGDFLFVRKF